MASARKAPRDLRACQIGIPVEGTEVSYIAVITSRAKAATALLVVSSCRLAQLGISCCCMLIWPCLLPAALLLNNQEHPCLLDAAVRFPDTHVTSLSILKFVVV